MVGGTGDGLAMAHSQILRGFTQLGRQDDEAARTAAVEAVRIAEAVDDGTLGLALHLLAITELDQTEARRVAEQAADHLERGGNLRSLARMWEDLAYTALLRGELDEARALIGRSLARATDRAESVLALGLAGVIALESGDDADATRQFRNALFAYRARGITPGLSRVLLALATRAAREGETERAGRLLGAATAMRSRRSTPGDLEQRLEAQARALAAERCDPVTLERALHAGLRLTPPERIELGFEAARAGL